MERKYAMTGNHQWKWSQLERKCLSLLQQKHTKPTILQIHSFMIRNSLESNLNLLTKFITTCSSISVVARFSGIRHARQVFDHRLERDDTFLCSSMIKSHLDMRQFVECFTLYRDLRRETSFTPDNFTFSSLAKSCGCLDMGFREGVQLHNHVMQIGFCLDVYVSTSLLDMYAKLGKMGEAKKVFDEMFYRSEVSWTALVNGYARNGDMTNAKKFFDLMPLKDVAAFNMMIDAFVKFGDLGSAESLFQDMPEKNVVSWTSMLHGYCTNGDLDKAKLLFVDMDEKNLFSWNTMIGGYSQNKQPREALKLFHQLQLIDSLEPDGVTVVSVLPAIADLGALDLGRWIHRFVKMKKLDRSTSVCTALVDMYAKCGEIGKARELFDEITEKETFSWNAMINGYAVNGNGKEALKTFSEMKVRGFKPNEITLIGVLSACNHSGLVEEGKILFSEMKELGLKPKIEHYGCMVDLLGKAGCVEEAEKMMESMPFEANAIILSSFLYACGHLQDVARAERVLTQVIKIEPRKDGNYVMVRNLYAREKRWTDVEEIKGLMRENRVNKEVGVSVIEVDSRVCEFTAGDRCHPHWDVIHFILHQLLIHLKDNIDKTFTHPVKRKY